MTKQAAQLAMREGRLQDARRYLEALVATTEDGPELRYNLALVQVRLENFADAADHFEVCARAAPRNPEILNNLGNCQRLSGQLKAADRTFDTALQFAPRHPSILANRGWLMLATNRPEEALECFKVLISVDPALPEGHRGLAEACLRQGDLEQARNILIKAIRQFPGHALLLQSLGACFAKMRDPEQALVYFGRALEHESDNPETLLNHGICAEQVGELALAEERFEQAINVKEGFAAAHFHLSHLPSHLPDEEEIRAIERALQRSPGSRDCIDLQFALGKSRLKISDFAGAFQAFSTARASLSRLHPFSMESALSRINAIEAADHTPGELEPCKCVFVIGMPRSGTTLVDQILASHSRTVSLGESGITDRLLRRYRQQLGEDYPATSVPSEQHLMALTEHLRNDLRHPGKVVIDTSPSNLLYVGLLSQLLPEARFVYCQRDSRDTCVSIFEQPLTEAHGYANNLRDLGRYYAASFELAKHWRERLGHQFHIVNYEKVTAEPKLYIEALLSACELGFEAKCLDFHLHRRAVITPSAAQVREPVHARSVGRWQQYEAFLSPLLEALPEESFYRA